MQQVDDIKYVNAVTVVPCWWPFDNLCNACAATLSHWLPTGGIVLGSYMSYIRPLTFVFRMLQKQCAIVKYSCILAISTYLKHCYRHLHICTPLWLQCN